jgi:hypothetical protein
MPILGMRLARTPVAQIADTLRLDREQVERRIDAILSRLKAHLAGGYQDPPEAPRAELSPERARRDPPRRGLGGLATRMVTREPVRDRK